MLKESVGKITSTGAWLLAAAKQFDKIASWPKVDPSRQAAIEELANSLERAGIKLVELAEEIRNRKDD